MEIKELELKDIIDELDGSPDGKMNLPEELNLLPLREVVIFPVLVAPLGVGRENSVRLVNESVVGGNRIIGVATLQDPSIENPTLDDVCQIVQAMGRFEILEAVQTTPYRRVKIRPIPEPKITPADELDVEALKRSIA